MILMYVSNCATDYGLDGTLALRTCSPTMILVSVNAGWQLNCQAVLGMQGLYACSGHNSSPFGLIWVTYAKRIQDKAKG